MRTVLDSPVLAAAWVSRAGLCAELYEDVLQRHDLVVTPPLLEAVGDQLRCKFLAGDELVEPVIASISRAAVLVDPGTTRSVEARPPAAGTDRGHDSHADHPALAAALTGEADLLVTVDKDLLELGSYAGVDILPPGDFWQRTAR